MKTSMPKPIIKSKDRRGHSVSSQERKSVRQTNIHLTASGIVRSTKEARVYIQELGTYSYVKFVEDSPSVLSLRRLCGELECSYSWQPGGNPTQKARRLSRVVPAISFPRRDHSLSRLLRLPGTTPPGAALYQTMKLRIHATFTRTFLRKFEGRRRSIGQGSTFSRKKKPGGTSCWEAYSVSTDAEKTLTPKTRQGELTIPNRSDTTMCSRISQKDPNCELCNMTKTTHARCINRPLKHNDDIPTSNIRSETSSPRTIIS